MFSKRNYKLWCNVLKDSFSDTKIGFRKLFFIMPFNLGLSALNGQFSVILGPFQSPVVILGARADVALTSLPVHLRYLTLISLG